MRALSKALFSELSGEPSTNVIPIFVQKLCEFFHRGSTTFARSKCWKSMESKNSVHHYKKSKVYMPPQKLASKIVKPSVKNFFAFSVQQLCGQVSAPNKNLRSILKWNSCILKSALVVTGNSSQLNVIWKYVIGRRVNLKRYSKLHIMRSKF